MQQRQHLRLPILVGAGVLSILFACILTFFISHQANAVYECGTYGAGDYSSETYDANSCETAPSTGTDTGPTTGSGSSTGTGSGSGSSSPGGLILPVEDPVVVEQTSTVDLEKYARYLNGDGQHFLSKQGQLFSFLVDGMRYIATLKEVSAERVVFTISGSTDEIVVKRSETATYDVDKDGKADISFAYSDLNGDQAEVIIHKVIPVTTTETTAPATEDSKGSLWFLLWLIPLLLIVIWIIIALVRRRNAQKDQ